METVFWIALLFVLYTYWGYPLFLYTKSLVYHKKVQKADLKHYPMVSVIIAARNEQQNIERRIRNLMNQDYPKKSFEIIIVSDGSRDNTNAIVKQLMREINERAIEPRNILRLLPHTPSRGKPFAVNEGVTGANGEIIVFSDCRQRFSPDAIRQLVSNFHDQKVGCVSGELVFEETPESPIQREMGAYWKFEKWLRKLESKTGSVPGATGSIYAIRGELFKTIPEQTLLDDVLIPLNIAMQGYRIVFDDTAIAYDTVSKDVLQEKKRKIRTLAGNWQLVFLQPNLINPFKNHLWLRFFSHKIFRLLIPHCLIILLFTALFLRNFNSFLVLTAIALFIAIAVLPPLPGPFRIISKLSGVFRAVILLNYFALLAPIKLVFPPKELW